MAPNTFLHDRDISGPGDEAVVRPARDTLYSTAFLSLEAGPVVLDLPSEPECYVLFSLLDAYSNNFAGLGSASYGTAGGKYVIAGPDWTRNMSNLPGDMVRVDSPTNLVWMIGRTQVYGPDDVAAVNAIQDTYSLEPLNGRASKPTRNCVPDNKSVPPPEAVAAMSTLEFFGRLDSLMAKNPPPAADAEIVDKLSKIGVGPGAAGTGGRFSVIALRLSKLTGVSDGESAVSVVQRFLGIQGGSKKWIPDLQDVFEQWSPDPSLVPIGDYGMNYFVRFRVARVGFGANRAEYSVYQNTTADRFQRALDGSKRSYTITFPKGQLPPVTGFWSLSV